MAAPGGVASGLAGGTLVNMTANPAGGHPPAPGGGPIPPAGRHPRQPHRAGDPAGAAAAARPCPGRSRAGQLQKLITGMVRPYSWQDLGGPGKLDYYDIGGALVVNQTADVIREVQDLLDALRRLQDLSMTVEVRVISLSEAFFERVGVDFQANIMTKSSNKVQLENQITSASFAPAGQFNTLQREQRRHRVEPDGRRVHLGPGRADPAEHASASASRSSAATPGRGTAGSTSGWRS